MSEEKKVNIGREILNLRSLLKLKREEFAKITSMSVDEIENLEKDNSSITVLQRFKICIALETILKYHREKYHPIVVGQIEKAIVDVGLFNSKEEFVEVSNMFRTLNDNIENFRTTHQESRKR